MPDDPTPPPSPSDPPQMGVENYQLGCEIATGGMGSVLEAEDTKLGRTVAIKVMLLEGNADEVMRRRFIREAQVLAMLAHPNIVPIHDIVWEDGLPLFYSMKLVKGRTLAAILKDLRKEDAEVLRDFPLTHLLDIFRKVCDAIAFAHSKGVLHRDLKPENVMIGEFGEVLVMDWGLAKLLGSEVVGDTSSAFITPHTSGGATLAGAVLGTPQYMSPEQARGSLAEVDELSDIYALGGILYAILTLRPPVEGLTALEVLEKVSRGEITPPTALQKHSGSRGKPFEKGRVLEAKQIKPLPHVRGGHVPLALSSVAMKALNLEKGDRYPSVTALEADIDAYLSGFATHAEQAGTLRQLWLLMFRHPVFMASLAVLLLTSVGFVGKIIASERRAQASAAESQRSLAKAQKLLADVAFYDGDPVGMTTALDSIPEALRDETWDYLSARRDVSLGPLKIPGFWEEVEDVAAIPHQPGQFAIASRNGKIGIVDVVSRKLLRTIDTGDAGDVRIAVSGDGTRLLSRTGVTTNAHLFDTATGEKLITIKLGFYRKQPSPIFNHSVAINEDGSLAVFSFPAKKEIHLFDMESGTLRWTQTSQARQMLFHPNGEKLIVAREGQNVLVALDLATGKVFSGEDPYPINAQSISLSPDGNLLAAALNNGELVMVNLAVKNRIARKLSEAPIGQIAFTSGGNLLTLNGGNKAGKFHRALQLFEPVRRNHLGTFMGLADYPAYLPLRIHPDSGHLLTLQSPPQLWHFPDKPLAQLRQKGEIGWSCDFLSDSVLLARKGKGLDLYDVSDVEAPAARAITLTTGHGITAAHPQSGLFATAFPYGTTTTATTSDALRLWQFTPDGIVEKWAVPALNRQDLTIDLNFDAQGERLVRVVGGGSIEVLSTETGETLAKLSPRAYRAAFAGTLGYVVMINTSQDENSPGRVLLVDPSDGKVQASTERLYRFISLAVSPDLRLVAVAGAGRAVIILDADTLEEKQRFFAHDNNITALRFHPIKPLLATGSADHSVKIWDYETEHLEQTFLGLKGSPMHLAFSPNGRLLAVDGMEYALNIFGVESASE